MNESITPTTNHFTACARLSAIGANLKQLDLFGPIKTRVQIKQKTMKHTPIDKLMDAFISLLAGAHGLVEITTRLRADLGLQRADRASGLCRAIGRAGDTGRLYDRKCGPTASGARRDLSLSQSRLRPRLPGQFPTAGCGPDRPAVRPPSAAFATKGYFAGLSHRRGRQLGRVLATLYEEVVVDQLFAGNVQLIKALQPLVEAAETTLQLDEAKRRRTIIRVDAGAGTQDDRELAADAGL